MRKVKESRLQTSPSFQVWQLNNQYQRHATAVLNNLGLTYVEFVLMTVLIFDMNKVAANQKWLAHYAGTDKNMTSEVLRSLQSKRLIIRTRGIIDGRAVSIRASAKGLQLYYRARQVMANVDKHLLGQLSGTGLAKLLQ